MEDWEPIRGFPGYSVNRLGQVRKDSTRHILAPQINQYGVPYVGLMRDWKQQQRSLAKLVARTFIPNESDIFDTPINLDGNRFNCAVENLMWRPRWFAVRYNQQFTHNRYQEPIGAPVRAIETGEVFRDSFDAACRYGVLEGDLVTSVKTGKLTWPIYITFELA
jgi:hypothetical protein